MTPPADAGVRLQCVAAGRVQGVGYRARVIESAERHGVRGTVMNRADGTVLIEVQGEPGAVERFLADVTGRRGLSDARSVTRVRELPVDPALDGFAVRGG
jgi:acylphosphatase